MPVDNEIAVKSVELPGEFHKDPADRIIVATARKLPRPSSQRMTKFVAIRTCGPSGNAKMLCLCQAETGHRSRSQVEGVTVSCSAEAVLRPARQVCPFTALERSISTMRQRLRTQSALSLVADAGESPSDPGNRGWNGNSLRPVLWRILGRLPDLDQTPRAAVASEPQKRRTRHDSIERLAGYSRELRVYRNV